ncbi:DeoR/GlpR family DNA-binding transcription regulator [Vibrio mangrovi]|uniref:DeoR/GlpR family DNA-binding transcription regulator n=1 Tax=Vibrio mangrovi TaxID=474394 RepID=A0A1Y6IX43_9VIBR|nr:DeoR/GlpR family DNA-binding transcription regulator [Vibrio mangrovi]MDW6004771.1 DeoR/GlpR family DNA-binding transcription regulator [Vibrio mangrovi]SMS01062.1 HTH-type transcriptional repressor GlcR [Vibrio mangrovi]
MTQEERLLELETLIKTDGKITLPQICERFSISADSARRDLVKLAELPDIMRIRGGAIFNRLSRHTMAYTEKPASSRKQTLAQKAATLIRPGEHVLIDSGTTLTTMMPYLPEPLTIVTNAPDILQACQPSSEKEIFLLGGQFNAYHRAMLGTLAEAQLAQFNVDKAFIGVCALSESGLMTTLEQEATMKRAMMSRASQVILVSESHKFGQRNLFTVCELDQIDIIVTDPDLSETDKDYLLRHDIELIITNE